MLIQSNFGPIAQGSDSYCEILTHGGKNVRVAEEWRGSEKLCKLFFSRPVYQGFTPYYVISLFRNKIFIQHQYVVEGFSAQQIAKKILCSKTAVLNALERFGIPIREPHQHHGNPSQPKYGDRFFKRKLITHKIEQRVINVVKELYEKGLSLRHIARVLNEMQIATKNIGKGWHPEMIKRIIQNLITDG